MSISRVGSLALCMETTMSLTRVVTPATWAPSTRRITPPLDPTTIIHNNIVSLMTILRFLLSYRLHSSFFLWHADRGRGRPPPNLPRPDASRSNGAPSEGGCKSMRHLRSAVLIALSPLSQRAVLPPAGCAPGAYGRYNQPATWKHHEQFQLHEYYSDDRRSGVQ
jgi:hypothetical protein